MSKISHKETIVKEIQEKFSKSTASILTDYKGLTVEKMTELRNTLRKADAEYKVYKNTLSNLAYKDAGVENAAEYFKGPTAIAFSKNDPVVIAKILTEFQKDNEVLEIKGGTLGDKVISKDQITVLASLPSRDILLSQLLSVFNGPISGMVNVMAGTIRKLANVVKAIQEKKEQAA